MIERSYRTSLALETFAELGVGNFDGNDAIQARVTCFVDLAHPARADWRVDFIGSEFVARRKRHVLDSAKSSRSRDRECITRHTENRVIVDLCASRDNSTKASQDATSAACAFYVEVSGRLTHSWRVPANTPHCAGKGRHRAEKSPDA